MVPELDDDDVDEQPQRRREWSGPMRSIVLPIAAVTAIVGAIWAIESRDKGVPAAGDTGIVARPTIPGGVEVAAERGKVAPDFVLQTVDGKSVRLSDYSGKPVFVNFWATWCAPCRKEMPKIIAAAERYGDRGLSVIAVNVQEDRDTTASFVREFGIPFPAVLDLRGGVAAAYRVQGLPTSCFIDRRGVIQSVWFGPLSTDELERQLKKIL